MVCFLYDNGLRHERVKRTFSPTSISLLKNEFNSKAGILVSRNLSKLISVEKT